MDACDILKTYLNFIESSENEKANGLLVSKNQYGYIQELRDSRNVINDILPYDPECCIAALYAKSVFLQWTENRCISLFNLFSNPNDLDSIKDLWQMFHSPDVEEIETTFLTRFSNLLDSICATAIGERDLESEKKTLLNTIIAVCKELPKCNVDLFLRHDSTLPAIKNFSTRIHLFSWLSECLTTLESVQDGIYVCYIRNSNLPKKDDCQNGLPATPDGYFGFYLKSNGSILSINERVNEIFPGEHKRHRNARYSENRKFLLFPYDTMFDFSDYDYKGFATAQTIDESKTDFLNLGPETYMPLIVSMLLLSYKYSNYNLNDLPIKYVDSLLPVNLANPTPGNNALVIRNDSSLIRTNSSLSLNMTTDGIIAGAYAHRLNGNPDTAGRHWTEYGNFAEGQNIFVELYGDGFQADIDRLLENNLHLKRLTRPNSKDTTPNSEFVGTEIRMEIAAYKQARSELAEYIRDQMYLEYQNAGGIECITKWYEDALRSNQEYLFELCARRFEQSLNSEDKVVEPIDGINIAYHTGVDYGSESYYPLNESWRVVRNGSTVISSGVGHQCCVSSAKANVFFSFQIKNWHDIQTVTKKFDADFPKILMGYTSNSRDLFGYNPIISATDACFWIGTPFERDEYNRNWRYWTQSKWQDYRFWNKDLPHDPPQTFPDKRSEFSFSFSIGFSKRAWNALYKKF